ncbi:MAG TPA: ABC transporter ATP-binding protein [Alphaproteobacteria bacterium]|nr:ABC transporter ATP-binding protein [Alphaproteobacteria bacterium]
MTLAVKSLVKRFGDFLAVDDIAFDLARGQFLSLLGPSGCGKTTTLRMIAGFESPTGGSIMVNDQDITRVPARRRNIGMVFQNYALFPHMTVAQNVAFGLQMRHLGRAEVQKKVRSALRIVRMSDHIDKHPRELSGGQQQRVALARALVIEPDLLLLDEPLSALDLKLREEMRDEIHRITRELDITTVFVTHDQGEALVLSDRVAVMNRGRIEQLDSPEEIYKRPLTPFVADFIGGSNVIRGQLGADDGRPWFTFGSHRLPLEELPADRDAGPLAISIRPEHVRLGAGQGLFQGQVERRRFLGSIVEYTVGDGDGLALTVRDRGESPLREGERVGVDLPLDRIVFLSRT